MTALAVQPLPFPTAPTDADLLHAVACGDRPALGELARRYVDFVYASAARQLHDRHAAEDVTQAVFLTLARKASRVRPYALSSWLHRTTRYAALNARRADRRRSRHERAAAKPEGQMPYVLPEPDPLLPLLDEAVASRRAGDRHLIVERYLRGRAVEPIAEAMNLSPKTTQKRIERAVLRLRRQFERRGVPTAAAAVALTLAAVAPTPATAAPPALAIAVGAASLPAPAGGGAAALAHAVGVALAAGPMKAAAATVVGVGLLATTAAEVARRHAAPPPVVATRPATAPSTAPAARPAAGPLVARLGNGVRVELLAVSPLYLDVPPERTDGWSPDGTRLAAWPYLTPGLGQRPPEPPLGRVVRQFVVRIEEPPGGRASMSILTRVPNARDSRTAPSGVRGGADGGSLHAVIADVPLDRATVRVEVGVAPFVTLLSADAGTGAQWPDGAAIGPVRASASEDAPGSAEVTLAWPLPTRRPGETVPSPAELGLRRDYRMVAVDALGVEHVSDSVEVPEPGVDVKTWVRHTVQRFTKLRPDAVRSVRWQARPCEWVEFHDVTTTAGRPTTPRAVTSAAASPSATLPDGTTLTFLGVATAPSRQNAWFAPDGKPMPTRPYGGLIHTPPLRKEPFDGQTLREYAFERLTGSDADAAALQMVVNPPPADTPGEPDDGGPTWTELSETHRDPGRVGVIVRQMAGRPATVRFLVAAGPGIPTAASRPDADVAVPRDLDFGPATLKRPFEHDGKAAVTLNYAQRTARTMADFKLVAVDTRGRERLADLPIAELCGGDGTTAWQTMAVRGVPLKDVVRFELRLRPFKQWVAFSGLPAAPGDPATITVRNGIVP